MMKVTDVPNRKVYHVCHESCANHYMKGQIQPDGRINLDYRFCISAGQRIKGYPLAGEGGGDRKEPLCLMKPNIKDIAF